MTPHEQRLHLLADALLLRDLDQVVPALRRKNVVYYGPGGTLLFAPSEEWSDERLVKAAIQLLADDDAATAN